MDGNDLLRLLSRWRIEVATVVAVPAVACAQPTEGAILRWLPLLVAGLALRTWARGHIDRTCLTTSGPYARLRHPLYVGSFAIGLALALMTRRPLLAPIYTLAFVGMYWPKAVREERFLRRRWGAEWERYAAAVGAIVPRRAAAGVLAASGCRFRWRRVVRHREWKTWLGAVALVAVLWLRAG
ncbi:MAG TPA: methyltransferase [Candidatus Binatia bacterium]|nr:methyltransferase [Candidatus Binatia bacterium]